MLVNTQTQKDTMVKVVAHTTPDLFADLREDWNSLLAHSVTDTIFSTWQWHQHWWTAYHAGELWVLTLHHDDGALIGIAPWFIEHHAERGRIVRCIGSEDVTDYLDVIIHADYQAMAYDGLAQYLIENRDAFDVIDLCNIPQASPTYTHFPQVLEQCGFDVQTPQQDVCPVIRLDGSWDDYLAELDKKQRHEIRRKLRKAHGQSVNGSLEWYTVDESHDLNEKMAIFLDLMAKSQDEKADFLQDEQHVAFFKSMVPAMQEAGWLRMNFLVINGHHVAAYLNFDYGNHILVYNSGLDSSQFGHLSPGIVLLSYNIQDAIDKGRAVFDFLRGDETYKYRMGGKDTSIYNLKARFNA